MNKTQLFACVAGVLVSASAFAQGTFAFSNATLTGKPKINGADGNAIAGANFLIEVLVKNPTTGEFTNAGLLKVTTTGDVPAAAVSPLTGANAGLFAGGTIKVPFVAPDAAATITVRAWDKTTGATYADALANGVSGSITFDIAKLGGSGSPPSLPASMANFSSFALTQATTVIPEASTYALAALGLGGLLLFRRK